MFWNSNYPPLQFDPIIKYATVALGLLVGRPLNRLQTWLNPLIMSSNLKFNFSWDLNFCSHWKSENISNFPYLIHTRKFDSQFSYPLDIEWYLKVSRSRQFYFEFYWPLIVLKIKPCGLESTVLDMEAERHKDK